jgi:hypothetical protein
MEDHSPPPTSEPTPPARPEGLPDAYWDADASAVRLPDLVRAHGELSAFKADADARLAKRPAAADAYELRVPEAVKLPDGAEFRMDAASPLAKAARQFAYDAGLDQAGFDTLVEGYVEEQVRGYQAAGEALAAEMAKLGEKAETRIGAVDAFLKSALTATQYEALKPVVSTAAAVEAVEALMKRGGGPAMPTAPAGGGADAVTEAALRRQMEDPRYWRDRDPDFVAKVAEGFRKLYPGQVQAAPLNRM